MKERVKSKRAVRRGALERFTPSDAVGCRAAMASYLAKREPYVPLAARTWPAPSLRNTATATA
jgi:hypothetical protein